MSTKAPTTPARFAHGARKLTSKMCIAVCEFNKTERKSPKCKCTLIYRLFIEVVAWTSIPEDVEIFLPQIYVGAIPKNYPKSFTDNNQHTYNKLINIQDKKNNVFIICESNMLFLDNYYFKNSPTLQSQSLITSQGQMKNIQQMTLVQRCQNSSFLKSKQNQKHDTNGSSLL